MAIINLRDYYPFYTSDCFMEVSEEVAEMFKEFDRKEAAYRLRTYRHKAYYSLDRDDGLEHEAVFVALKDWRRNRRSARSLLPAVRAVDGGFSAVGCGVYSEDFLYDWRLTSVKGR